MIEVALQPQPSWTEQLAALSGVGTFLVALVTLPLIAYQIHAQRIAGIEAAFENALSSYYEDREQLLRITPHALGVTQLEAKSLIELHSASLKVRDLARRLEYFAKYLPRGRVIPVVDDVLRDCATAVDLITTAQDALVKTNDANLKQVMMLSCELLRSYGASDAEIETYKGLWLNPETMEGATDYYQKLSIRSGKVKVSANKPETPDYSYGKNLDAKARIVASLKSSGHDFTSLLAFDEAALLVDRIGVVLSEALELLRTQRGRTA